MRRHQEDICQALGRAPTQKYEVRQGGGGPEFEEVAALLDRFAVDVEAQLDRLAAVAAFTAIIGNADAHGKNLALVHEEPGQVVLAPLYDTVPAVLWPRLVRDAAMTIGGGVSLDGVDRRAIGREARRWHHDPDRAIVAAERVAGDLIDALDAGVIDPSGPLAHVVRERSRRFQSS